MSTPSSLIGIVARTEQELTSLRTPTAQLREMLGAKVWLDQHEGRPVVLIAAGTGKVATAMATTILIQKFNVAAVISVGLAEFLKEGQDGHTYFIDRCVQVDYGTLTDTERTITRPGAFLYEQLDPFFTVRPEILKLAENQPLIGGLLVERATLASSDTALLSTEARQHVANFGCDLLDMDTAALAQVAEMAYVPWAAAKSVVEKMKKDVKPREAIPHIMLAVGRASELARRLVQQI